MSLKLLALDGVDTVLMVSVTSTDLVVSQRTDIGLGSVLFLTWHRPYLALVEVSLLKMSSTFTNRTF
jgi:hypothetical protein